MAELDERLRILSVTISKLYHRDAIDNIKKVFTKTHTADIATVLETFKPDERIDVFRLEHSLEKRAEILSHFDESVQREILDRLEKKEILKLVPLMESDDAADLLGNMSEEESKEILKAMVKEDSEDVADLLAHPVDSAGGLMTSDYLAVDQTLTVADTIKAIQDSEDENLVVFYIYVLNEGSNLVGVVSLKQLLLSKSSDQLKDLMSREVFSVSLDVYQEEVAKTVERYDFLSLPVVDNNNKLVGVITVDDILDVIREQAEEDLLSMGQAGWEVDASVKEHFKARLPWLLFAFTAGVGCFSIVYFFGSRSAVGIMERLWLVAAFIPMLLALGGTSGSQAVTVSLGALRAGYSGTEKMKRHFKKELILGLLFSVLFGVVVFLIGESVFSYYQLSESVALVMGLQIFLSMTLGALLPMGMQRLGMDVAFASVPIFTAVADLVAVALLFGLLPF